MNKITKIVFCTLFLSILLPHVCISTQSLINTSVELSANIGFDAYINAASFCYPEKISLRTDLINIGNLALTGNLSMSLANPYRTDIESEDWLGVTLNPEDSYNFFLNHTINSSDTAGIHRFSSNFTYNDTLLVDSGEFRLKSGYGTLAASPSLIEKTLYPDEISASDIYLWLVYPCYGTSVFLNTSSGAPGNWTTFTQDTVWVPTQISNSTIAYVDVPWNAIPGDYNGYVYAYVNDQLKLSIPITIHVQYDGIFDISTEVKSSHTEVCRGNKASAEVSVTKIFPNDTLDINLTYRIETNNTIYVESLETVSITNSLVRNPTLTVPSSAPTGIYTFYAILNASGSNWTSSTTSYDIFTIKDCSGGQPSGGGGGGGSGGVTGAGSAPIQLTKEILLNVSKTKLLSTIGNTTSFLAWVENTGDTNLNGVKVSIEGIPDDWITIYPKKIDLNSGETKEFLVFIRIPEGVGEGVYELKVTASDEGEKTKSKTEILTLFIGRDEESLTRILFEELDIIRGLSEQALNIGCINTNELNPLFDEGERLRSIGIGYMNSDDHKKSQEFFVQAISVFEESISKADFLMEIGFYRAKIFSIFPFSKIIKEKSDLLVKSIEERNYAEYCSLMSEIRKYSLYSILIIILLASILITILVLIIVFYRRRRRKRTIERIDEIKSRLGGVIDSKGSL